MKDKQNVFVHMYLLFSRFKYICFLEVLCTFTKTGTTYAAQEWYNCETCTFGWNEGVCSVCVNTCHAGHDVSYAGYSERFFCDCGARGEESCISLTGELI